MLLSRCLGVDLSSNHLDNLLTNNFIVQVEALEACNQLSRVGNMILGDFLRILLTIILEKVIKLFYFPQKSDGIDFSSTKQWWMGKLRFLTLSS
jgi:hypothetical protein